MGPRFWSARVGPDRFVGVDTSEIESPGPFLGDLAAALAEDARYRLVFLHRPVARPGRTRAKFAPLAKVLAEGNVTAVFAGHLHHWETFEHEGVLHVTNGRGGDLTGKTTSDAAIGLVSVTPEGVTVREVGIGERSEILPILVSGVVTRIWEPFGAFLTLGAAILFALAGILLVPRRPERRDPGRLLPGAPRDGPSPAAALCDPFRLRRVLGGLPAEDDPLLTARWLRREAAVRSSSGERRLP